MFAPNERIAPFPNFPQPMFERPTPSCKHTHKSTNFLEALPVDARQSRKKDRIHAKASPNIRCPKTRRSSTGCANLKKHKVAYGRKSRTSTPLLSEFRPDTPPVPPPLVVRNPERSKSVSAVEGLRLLDSRYAQSFHPAPPPARSGFSVRRFSIRSRRAPGHRKPTKRLSRPLPSLRRSAYREP